MGPLQGSRVKIRGHMIAYHGTPISPRTITYVHSMMDKHRPYVRNFKRLVTLEFIGAI